MIRSRDYKDHLYLAAVVGIDRARGVEHRDAVARRGRSAPHLAFKAARQCEGDAVGICARPPGAIVTGISAGTAATRSSPAASAL